MSQSDKSSFTQTFQINVAPAASPVHGSCGDRWQVFVCLFAVTCSRSKIFTTFSGVNVVRSDRQISGIRWIITLDAGYMHAYSLPRKLKMAQMYMFSQFSFFG